MRKSSLLAVLLVLVLMVAGVSVSFAKLAPSQPDFPNAKLLVSADSVEDTMGSKNFVIIDARTSGYETSHIPGAINIIFGNYFTAGTGLLPVTDLNTKLSQAGLKRNMTFVIYDNTSASFGAAGRIFWMLEYLGCKKVYILDGGWDKWVADGRQTETAINTLPAAKFKAAIKKSKRMTKEIIQKKLGTKNFAVVDARTDEEYNGWQLYGEARGGHMTGAIQLPYEWFFNADKTVLNYSDLKTMFESRGITRKKQVTAYCTVGIRSGFVYFLYRLMGYNKASNYDGSMIEWAADPSLPMEKASNYQALVYPGWVKNLIDTGNNGNPYVIVETGWGSADASGYNNGHIPGAIHVNTDEIEYDTFPARNAVPADELDRSTTAEEDLCKGLTADDTLPRNWWDLYPDQYLLPAIACMGIDKDTTVVVYGKSSSAAARIVWTLMYAGVKDVRLLNGALKAWVAAGYDVETTPTARQAVASFGATQALHPEYLVNTDYIQQVSNDPNSVSPPAVIVDIRSWDEYTGASTPYSYIPTLGRIPGAAWGHNSGDLMDSIDGTLRSYPEVKTMWQEYGITSDKSASFYCGTAWRASLAFFEAYIMGWQHISNYDESWYYWSMGPGSETRPIATGTP